MITLKTGKLKLTLVVRMKFSINIRIIGTKKIILYYTIVKPRVERVHFVEKSSKGSLEDIIAGKMFL